LCFQILQNPEKTLEADLLGTVFHMTLLSVIIIDLRRKKPMDAESLAAEFLISFHLNFPGFLKRLYSNAISFP
jgi:hypothetical protein